MIEGYFKTIKMSVFNENDFPTLGGESISQKKSPGESPEKKSKEESLEKRKLAIEVVGWLQTFPSCFVCGSKEKVHWGEWSICSYFNGEGLCEDCCSRTPRIEILKRYIGKTTPEECSEWMKSRKGTLHEIQTVSEWITVSPEMWSHEYPEDVKNADLFMERWESIYHWSIWTKEKRYKGEEVAWYSSRQKKIVVGKVNKVNKDGMCQVYRKPETEEEKELGNFFQKDIHSMRLLPHLSQKESLAIIRKSQNRSRGEEHSPFKCCGPCNRVRISTRAPEDAWNIGWSGPHNSPHVGQFCKECVVKMKTHKRDLNLTIALREYSDYEHRGFGGVYVDNWGGKPGRTFRTCSCYKCVYPDKDNPHLKQNYTCESCGVKGNGCQGWFDRRSSTGGLPNTWEEEDHWFCKKCWIREYWVLGEWTTKEDGSKWFKCP